jgi:acyl dehydratase
MNPPTWDTVEIGDAVPSVELPPVERATLVLFADASGDSNPIHIDGEAARRAGIPDVIAHGMLVMAWLGRVITCWAPHGRLRRFDARFQGMTQLGDVIRCAGRVVEKVADGGERLVRIELSCVDQTGQTKIAGDALVALA